MKPDTVLVAIPHIRSVIAAIIRDNHKYSLKKDKTISIHAQERFDFFLDADKITKDFIEKTGIAGFDESNNAIGLPRNWRDLLKNNYQIKYIKKNARKEKENA
jgi:hypothetical protein